MGICVKAGELDLQEIRKWVVEKFVGDESQLEALKNTITARSNGRWTFADDIIGQSATPMATKTVWLYFENADDRHIVPLDVSSSHLKNNEKSGLSNT